jgi:hypothetical protein
MNKEIVDYLDSCWIKWKPKQEGNFYSFKSSSSGELVYHVLNGVLTLKADYQDEGYEVEIKDLQHLIQLEALL